MYYFAVISSSSCDVDVECELIRDGVEGYLHLYENSHIISCTPPESHTGLRVFRGEILFFLTVYGLARVFSLSFPSVLSVAREYID